MEINQFQQATRQQEFLNFPPTEEKEHRGEYFAKRYQQNKEQLKLLRRARYRAGKLGIKLKVVNGVIGGEPKPVKTKKGRNRTYYLKNIIRYLDTSRKQYQFNRLKKIVPQCLNKFSDYRRATLKPNYQTIKKKELCLCSKDRKDKALLLHCALNSKEKRTSTKEKEFNFSNSMTDYKELRE